MSNLEQTSLGPILVPKELETEEPIFSSIPYETTSILALKSKIQIHPDFEDLILPDELKNRQFLFSIGTPIGKVPVGNFNLFHWYNTIFEKRELARIIFIGNLNSKILTNRELRLCIMSYFHGKFKGLMKMEDWFVLFQLPKEKSKRKETYVTPLCLPQFYKDDISEYDLPLSPQEYLKKSN